MPRSIDDLVRPFIHHVSPYIPGKPVEEVKRELGLPPDAEIIKLASNENVLGTSPKALEVLKRAIHDVWLYPEDSCYYVRRALAEYHGVGPEYIYVGNGGVATLRDLGKLLLRPDDQAIASGPSFMKYRIVSQWAHDVETPVTDQHFLEFQRPDFSHDLAAMGAAINDRTKLVWVCSPNNPTGQTVGAAEVEQLVRVNDDRAIIIMDEAYADFVEPGIDYPDTIPYVTGGHHVVIMRTLAKIAGLAGLRMGYLIAPPRLVEYLDRIRLTFSVNRLAQEASIAAITDEDFKQRSRELVWTEKRYYYERLNILGWEYRETQANFIYIHVGMDSKEFVNRLMRKGIIVRPGWIFGNNEWVRVTFGTRAMNERFFEGAVGVVAESHSQKAVNV